ncbi:alpha/beta fold hydrolase [Lysobacter sp. F6437]|uniref:alpha/beta fold hydrolase n=1 Tax=Lysobacter sp. F6437 TaxID=3459296 RepID=UPI00403DEE22
MRAPMIALATAALLALVPASDAGASEEPGTAAAQVDPQAVASHLLDQLDAGNYAAANARFTAQMASAVPADKLQAVWESLPKQLGAARGRGDLEVTDHDGTQVVIVPLHYANGDVIASIAVTADGRIAGFMVRPAAPPAPPPPARDAAFIERDFSVGQGGRALPGTLALPKGDGPFRAVVLVHGSGPQDRNETVGGNRPFLDIARGLAARGIAVLRYDKRTQARPQDFADGDYDVDDETTDDAVAAVAALRATDEIDPGRVFVLGHSQGGMLAPRIAARSGQVAGLVMLAAPARSLLDILPEQNRYLLNADGSINQAEQDFLDQLDASIAQVRGSEPMEAADTPLGLPVRYWREFDQIDPVADALAIDVPMLLLQGGRDFQVVDTDWELWKKALADQPNATLRHYPALNHLGIVGEGPGSVEEYKVPGHVDPPLVDDIAEWIKR